MSLVERLAKDFAKWSADQGDVWDDEDASRWWLNAIADELDKNGEDHRTTGRPGEPHLHSWSSGWLRSQAQENDEDN